MSGVASTAETPEDPLFWQDEVLQAMYWMTKEGIRDRFDADGLSGFLDGPDDRVQEALDRLEGKGFLDSAEAGYAFTEEGERQAERRFAEAFHDLQGFDTSHTNCGPDCWCHDADRADEPCPSEDGHDHGA